MDNTLSSGTGQYNRQIAISGAARQRGQTFSSH